MKDIPLDKLKSQYNSGYSTKYLSQIYNCSVATIQRKLRQANCKFRELGHGCKKYQINEKFFDLIDDESKAYWLGVMLTGSTSSKLIRLSFKKTDELHLKKFLTSLSSTHPIKYQKKDNFVQAYVSIGNNHMRNVLIYKGVITNEKKIYSVSKELEKHYWRGVIDGGGKIDFKNKTIGITGNRNICEGFKSFCNKYIKTNANVKPHDSTWSFRLHGNIAFDIANILYKDSKIFLDRKHSEYLLWFDSYNNSPIYPKVVRFFKKVFSDVNLSILRKKMPKELEGLCIYFDNKYTIHIDKKLGDSEAVNCLLHELSHIKTMLYQKDPHGSAFGIAYSKIYKLYEAEFTEKYINYTL